MLSDIVTDNALRYPDVPAYRLGQRSVTHGALRERAVRLVSAMAKAGVRRQDRIAVLSRNSVEFGELMASTQLSGIIMATVNFRLSPPEVLDVLRRVSPSVVFCADEFALMIAELVQCLPSPPLLVSIGEVGRPDMVDYEGFVAGGDAGEPAFVAQPEDIACLLFTSGTTGASKCCVLGQRELRRVALTMNTELRSGSEDRGLINMPMFHFGAIGIIGGLHARGGTVVLQQQFDAAEAIRLLADEQITVLHLAPVMLRALIEELGDARAAASVRTVVYSAAPMSVTTLERALAVLPGAGFLNLYGQTEAIVSGLPRELHAREHPDAPDRLRSVGFPLPGVRVRIVGDDGRDVAAGEPGEIIIRSELMFRGYWDDYAATLATLRDGWCHTGDIGRFDGRGLLYLVDRKKDVIITGGENVYSPEVEEVVCELEGVAACTVIGVADDRWGEAVCAVVVPRPGAIITLNAVQNHVRQKLAGYKVPRRLVTVDELPVLASGKIDKKRLRTELGSA
ncbi:class I adenylate-forming enzyme family protein [Mycolicibacter algericus]|uniref:Acyl-CoA synthetase n=2 Tax=Mycolicibacter algericus TaxID=1288388 RepID=A0A7I9Y5M4_MYCAL|nr:AMP-binding protein [Mycolicibacter algericus]OQZ95072.1 AMP-dependent synthetase [Mycolicibacter algericus DSM 45454]GFG83961.1 acyl-CoA synthetase [Mycolicibacter algericus]